MPRTRRLSLILASTAACAASLWYCKPPAGSRIQNLTDAAAGGQRSFAGSVQCGQDYSGSEALPAHVAAYGRSQAILTPPGDDASRNAVLSALTAVPSSMLQLFFLIGNGQIIVGDAYSACQSTPFSAEERAIFGPANKIPACWLAQDSTQHLRIVLQADPKMIRFSLLRMFGFIQTEYFIARLQDPKTPAPFNTPEWRAYLTGFISTRQALAQAFLADMTAARMPKATTMSEHFSRDPISFGNMVYANAVDSYYCTAGTQADFRTQFPTAWRVFTDPTNAYAPLMSLGPLSN